ncbi:alanine racemase [Spirochaetia bacterium]|nr:alanine racemase [Spirochaetia bacterium]
MDIKFLETPALVLDIDAFDENIKTMKGIVQASGLKFRPHYKTHKCPQIAHRQIAEGACGITCAKLGEAEDLIQSGIENVFIANQIVDPPKIARLAFLAKCCALSVCVDSEENILALEKAAALQRSHIICLVEFDIGMERCGVFSAEAVLALAKKIQTCSHLEFGGIQAYAGNLAHETDFERRKAESEKVEAALLGVKRHLAGAGVSVREISGISTGTAALHGKNTVYTEMQAGSYIFMDTSYARLNLPFKNALFVLTQIVSVNPVSMVMDAGVKSLSTDQTMPVLASYPDVAVKLSEEHATISRPVNCPAAGEKLLMIPGHCCTTVNQYDQLYLVKGNKVMDRVLITSRGKSC